MNSHPRTQGGFLLTIAPADFWPGQGRVTRRCGTGDETDQAPAWFKRSVLDKIILRLHEWFNRVSIELEYNIAIVRLEFDYRIARV